MRLKQFDKVFLKAYPKAGKVLQYFESANGVPAAWENMTKLNLVSFVSELQDKLAPNSARQYCAKFKSILNTYNEEIELPANYAKILSLRAEKGSNIWLTDADLAKLENYAPRNKNEEIVRNSFLIGAYTGARHSDFMTFTAANLVNDSLVYVSKKTHIQATIPLKPIVRRLLKTTPKKNLSDPTFNSVIRRICGRIGINDVVKVYRAGNESEGEKWEFISSHTARRSFATNLYLRGADLYSISQLMGHSDIQMTLRYISCGLKPQSQQVLDYFK